MTDRPHCATCDDLLGDGWCPACVRERQDALSDTKGTHTHDKAEDERTDVMAEAKLLPTVWLMFTADGFYPIRPSDKCKPEDHGKLNDHVLRIEDADGNVLWRRVTQ